MKTIDLQIEGMSCGHCVRAVQQALAAVEGVEGADVEVGRAKVRAKEGVEKTSLARAIEDAGYSVR
jgi:copper chaperone